MNYLPLGRGKRGFFTLSLLFIAKKSCYTLLVRDKQMLHTPAQHDYTVLSVKISHGHDYTSCATLGHFEMQF